MTPPFSDLNETIGRLFDEREAYEQSRAATALLIIELERHGTAIAHILECAKTQLTGIRGDGTAA